MGMSSQREIAMAFLELAALGKVREAYNKYVDPSFRHHNAYFRGDRESLLRAMEESSAKNPNKMFKIKKVLEDRDIVVTYSHVQQRRGDFDLNIAVIHMFRFKEGMIVEMWDVGQEIPKGSPNENGMF